MPSALFLPWAPPMVTWYHSLPFLSTPRMPMLPMWWWAQAFMQPEMFRLSSPRSCRWSRSSKRAWMAWAMGIDLALASEQ
ncbi:hypothetical protein D3C81_2007280 [compost metagenome]